MANESAHSNRRFFVTCQHTKEMFLVDTGSDVSVYPHTEVTGYRKLTPFKLYTANGTVIPTYGEITVEPKLGLGRTLSWRFIIASVAHPIIGADFLAHYHLLTDLRAKKLVDGTTGIKTSGTLRHNDTPSIKSLHTENTYHQLLKQFNGIIQPYSPLQTSKYSTVHHIKTSEGSPEACCPRRLAPDRLQIAKTEFD